MANDAIIDLIQNLGLVAFKRFKEKYLCGIDVSSQISQGLPIKIGTRSVTVTEFNSDNNNISIADPLFLEQGGNMWSIKNCPELRLGAPNFEEFEFEVANRDELISVVQRYYFGEPIEVDGWTIPTHRIVYWSEENVKRAVADAKVVSFNEFLDAKYRGIDEIRAREIKTNSRETVYSARDCIYCPILNDSQTATLHLRMDCNEAFIVAESGCQYEKPQLCDS